MLVSTCENTDGINLLLIVVNQYVKYIVIQQKP